MFHNLCHLSCHYPIVQWLKSAHVKMKYCCFRTFGVSRWTEWAGKKEELVVQGKEERERGRKESRRVTV